MNQEYIRKQIDDAYHEFGFDLGWSFLYSPFSTLTSSDTVFLGLNPGGSTADSKLSSEEGSAYTSEGWAGYPECEAPLQKQVLSLFGWLGAKADDVLAGNLVPFRSPDWTMVKNGHGDREYAKVLEFARRLWTPILTQRPFRIVVMGRDCEEQVTQMLGAALTEIIPTGWGKTTARFYRYSGGEICALPHLSRYRIFRESKTPVELTSRIARMRAPQ